MLLLLACTDPASTPERDDSPTPLVDDSGGADDSAGGDDSGEEGPWECGAVTEPEVAATIPAVRLQGKVTWTLEFDETAEAAGLEDCSYTRHFDGVQVLDQPWTCPDCSAITEGTAVMTEGDDCYSQISETTGDRAEWWGVSADGRFFRTGTKNGPLGELGALGEGWETGGPATVSWSSESELSAGGVMILSAAGQVSTESDPSTLLPDYWAPRAASYAGGWPQEDPGNLEGDWTLEPGSVLPNFYLEDQCDDRFSVWDLYGSWIVLDASQHDCGPCQSMAAGEHAFVEAMAAQGIEVHIVTFLGNGLSDSLGEPSDELLDAWVEAYGLSEPVVKDRGYTYSVLRPFLKESTGEDWGYPSWVVVDPEMRVVSGNVGFSDWESVAEIIRENR